MTTEHEEDDYSKRPHVTFLWVISTKNFGSNIIWSTNYLSQRILLDKVSQSKVQNFYVPTLVYHYVFWFQVSVADVHCMNVIQSQQQVKSNKCNYFLIVHWHMWLVVKFNDIIKLFSRAVFHDHVNILVMLVRFIEPNHIRMIQNSETVNFLLNNVNFISKFFLLNGFYCSQSKMRVSQYDLSEGATAQNFWLDPVKLLQKVECG